MREYVMSLNPDDIRGRAVGDTFKHQGKDYRLIKKTSTAILAQRYYWFDRVGEWMWSKLGRS
jgi:hypothetical protein